MLLQQGLEYGLHKVNMHEKHPKHLLLHVSDCDLTDVEHQEANKTQIGLVDSDSANFSHAHPLNPTSKKLRDHKRKLYLF